MDLRRIKLKLFAVLSCIQSNSIQFNPNPPRTDQLEKLFTFSSGTCQRQPPSRHTFSKSALKRFFNSKSESVSNENKHFLVFWKISSSLSFFFLMRPFFYFLGRKSLFRFKSDRTFTGLVEPLSSTEHFFAEKPFFSKERETNFGKRNFSGSTKQRKRLSARERERERSK